ncbi:hypothetical protein [Streptomyces crystallinus]|uniref:Uncharacterized protein n=1 Tax=Streptomyces crystallinus TaxID=68191 RepID=A0ABP3RNK1_9ACTN
MLASRMYIWQEFDRIPKHEIRQVITVFHPVWAAADPLLIDAVDAEAAHGSFRNWANITHHLVAGMRKTGADTVTEALVHWVYSKIGGM